LFLGNPVDQHRQGFDFSMTSHNNR